MDSNTKLEDIASDEINGIAESSYNGAEELRGFMKPIMSETYLQTDKDNYIAGFREGFSYASQLYNK